MIRLIASDIDGTLIHGSQSELDPALFPLIRALKEKGILFAPASGRQYHSLRRLFAPAAGELCFLCENGGEVYGPSLREEDASPLCMTKIDYSTCTALMGDILARPDCSLMVSGSNICYLIPKDEKCVDIIRNFTGNHFAVVERMEEIPRDIIKISAFCTDGAEIVDKDLGVRWRAKGVSAAVAGPQWLDFTVADKGIGIRNLCAALNIAPEEVMAFGDNYNDVPMLEAVGHPVLMENAVEDLKKRYPVRCVSVNDVLRELLDSIAN